MHDAAAALVTGAASGIGAACALLLAQEGFRVAVADRDAAGAGAVTRQIQSAGGTALAIAVDVADSSACDRMVDAVVAAWGRLDVLVHAAGICPRQPLLEMTDEEWRGVLSVNLDGSFYTTRAAARVMRGQRSGTMVMLTSDRGTYGSADYAHYAASKGGMMALTKSLAIALGPHNVTVNGLNPGFTDTPLARAAFTDADWVKRHASDPLGRHSEPGEIAQTVLFLARTGGKYMTGQIVTTRMRY